jgi:hypothetical protein
MLSLSNRPLIMDRRHVALTDLHGTHLAPEAMVMEKAADVKVAFSGRGCRTSMSSKQNLTRIGPSKWSSGSKACIVTLCALSHDCAYENTLCLHIPQSDFRDKISRPVTLCPPEIEPMGSSVLGCTITSSTQGVRCLPSESIFCWRYGLDRFPFH